MRLPFLQVSQEEMARARTLAGYLGVPYAHALGMTVALKAAALEAAPEDDVSGDIRDPNPAEWMAVQCGWPLERADALATALVRCGFAMARPSGGCSVAGMEPYARALDTSEKRAEAGRKGAEARKAMGGYGRAMAGPQQTHGPGVTRDAKTQTQTQTQTQKESQKPPNPPGPADGTTPRPDAVVTDGQGRVPHEPPPPSEPPLMEVLAADFREARGVAYGDEKSDPAAMRELLAKGPPGEIRRRWRIGIALPAGKYGRVSKLADLNRFWNDCDAAPVAPGSVTRLDSRAPVRAESQPQYDPSKPAVTVRTGREVFGKKP